MSSSGGGINSTVGRVHAAVVAVIIAGAAVATAAVVTGGGSGATCDRNATSAATLATQVTAATTGQTICLATAAYGTFLGTNKAITIRAGTNQTPTMDFDFTTGDSGFTLDGITDMYGDLGGTAHDITIKNSRFTGRVLIRDLANANILFDRNDHTRAAPISGDPALIHLAYCCPNEPSGVTVQNSLFHDTDADGIQTGAGVNVINNEFRDILENGPNHTDSIQLIYAIGSVVRGNWFHNVADGIVGFDGVEGVLIEHNVVDPITGRWGIEIYSDTGSIIRHNTIVPRAGCTSKGCGLINLAHKAADPGSTGTQIYNNLTTGVIVDSGDTAARNDHNVDPTTAVYTGGSNPTTYAGYCLSPLSPVGIGAADNATNAGIAC